MNMLKELRSASERLRTLDLILHQYLIWCTLLDDSFTYGRNWSALDEDPELPSFLEKELAFISSCEASIHRMRVTVGHSRNLCINVTPINKLPSEILIQIFHFVSANSCPLLPSGDSSRRTMVPKYPDHLSHVCSHWRQVALSSPSLWAHIDLSPDPLSGRMFLNRAYTLSKRAGKVLYDIHIDDQGCTGSHHAVDQVVSRLAPRSRALEFVITTQQLLPFHSYVFQGLVDGCKPEIFERLCVSSNVSFPDPLIRGCDDSLWDGRQYYTNTDRGLDPNVIRASQDHIDHALAGVTTLHLQGVFFDWSRKLYHGLVDLRLTCPVEGKAPVIFESSLASILTNSPGLRILHFSLDLISPNSSHGHPIDPIPLQDIQVVSVSTIHARNENSRSDFHVGSLLRLLAPGSKPLRLTLETTRHREEPLFDSSGTRDFLARSKVEKLCIKNGCQSMDELAQMQLPDLKQLVFDSCSIPSRVASCLALGSCTWVIHGCTLGLSKLRQIVNLHPTGLVLSQVTVHPGGSRPIFMREEEIRTTFPNIQFLEPGARLEHTGWDDIEGY
jgi:hypothetical protein